MERSSQSKVSLDMYDAREALEAGLCRDKNMVQTLAVIQFNNLCIAFENIKAIVNMLDPERVSELQSVITFAISDTQHLLDSVLGNEREVSLDPEESE